MTRIYGFVIALLARLIMVGLGVLCLYSASFYFGMLLDPWGRQAIATNHFSQTETDWTALTIVGSIGAGLAIVALTLLFFGLRGLWRRLRAGLPSEDEARSETTGGRLVSAVIFGLGAALGLLQLTLLVYAVGDQIVFAWTGVETDAVVERKWTGDWAPPGSDEEARYGRVFALTYTTADGETVSKEMRVSGELYNSVEENGRVPIVYSASDPTESVLEFASPRAVLIWAFIWVGLISVGLVRLRRNLGADDPDGGAGRIARPLPQGPAGGAPATPGAATPQRRQFGQRAL